MLTKKQKLLIIIGRLLVRWRFICVYIIPALLALMFLYSTSLETRGAYIILVVYVFWSLELLPLIAICAIPMILLPLFQIATTTETALEYFTESNMTALGCIMAGMTIEFCGLHKRLALWTVLIFGTSPRWMMTGFMVLTSLMSLAVNSMVTLSMLIPIVEAILNEVYSHHHYIVRDTKKTSSSFILRYVRKQFAGQSTSQLAEVSTMGSRGQQPPPTPPPKKRQSSTEMPSFMMADRAVSIRTMAEIEDRIVNAVLLSVAYSATIGGMGTIIGSNSNLIVKQILLSFYGPKTSLTFLTWMMYNVPCMILTIVGSAFWLQFYFFGIRSSPEFPWRPRDDTAGLNMIAIASSSLRDMGRISYNEIVTVILLVIMFLLWITMDNSYDVLYGWGNLFHPYSIGLSTPTFLIVSIFFLIPSKRQKLFKSEESHSGRRPLPTTLLTWSKVRDRIPWGIVFLLGTGNALLIKAAKKTGLLKQVATFLQGMPHQQLSSFPLLLVVCTTTLLLTGLAPNTATSTIILPLIALGSAIQGGNPLQLMLPTAATSTCAFLIPSSTPSTAVVLERSGTPYRDAFICGIGVSFICIIVQLVMIETLGAALFDLHNLPQWTDEFLSNIISED